MTVALRTSLSLLGDRDEAADVAQDVALDVLKGVRSLRSPDAFDGWVRKIAVRHTVRALKRRRERLGGLPSMDETLLLEVPEPTLDHDLLIAARGALNTALSTLPERQRLALVLRYVCDLTDREIAESLGCRKGTVNALLSRGRTALRQSPALLALDPPLEATP